MFSSVVCVEERGWKKGSVVIELQVMAANWALQRLCVCVVLCVCVDEAVRGRVRPPGAAP